MHVAIVVAEKAYLEIIHQPANLAFIEQQTGNSHQGDAVVRNAFRQIELRKNLRLQQGCDQIVGQLNGSLRTGQKATPAWRTE